MNTIVDDLDLEHDLVQWIVEEAVRMAMATPLREPILAAVEGSTDESVDAVADRSTGDDHQDTAAQGKSRVTTAAQGLVVFAVIFVTLYVLLKRLTGGGEEA